MVTANGMAEVAAAVGEPARAAMLTALMDGRALTASELARVAAITPQTASSHLARLIVVGLIGVEKQGRHRYHRMASPAVAQMIEGIMQIAGGIQVRLPARTGPRDLAMRAARTCYDHLAGQLGVDVTEAMQARGAVVIDGDGAVLTEAGRAWMCDMGILKPEIGFDNPEDELRRAAIIRQVRAFAGDKGYEVEIAFDEAPGHFHGEVAGLRDVITFQERTAAELCNAFLGSVGDYFECSDANKPAVTST